MAVEPQFEDDVTEENELLVSQFGLGEVTDDDGNLLADISQAGSYIKIRFPDEQDTIVVYELQDLVNEAAGLADVNIEVTD